MHSDQLCLQKQAVNCWRPKSFVPKSKGAGFDCIVCCKISKAEPLEQQLGIKTDMKDSTIFGTKLTKCEGNLSKQNSSSLYSINFFVIFVQIKLQYEHS
jgi:hypothetical protein